jgi:glc operon protein GlcG
MLLARRSSKFFEDRVKERPAFANFPAGILIQGGLPIMHRNECVGAIGVSGVQSHEDEQVAQAGVKALG